MKSISFVFLVFTLVFGEPVEWQNSSRPGTRRRRSGDPNAVFGRVLCGARRLF